jgi:uncharacterized protein (DUF58 family)
MSRSDQPEDFAQRAATRLRPTGAFLWWVITTLTLIAVGWIKTINLVLMAAYILVVLVGVNAYSAYRMVGRLRIKRRVTPPVFAREPVQMILEVTNTSSGSAIVKIREVVQDQPHAWFLPHLPSQASVTVGAELSFEQRGRHPVEPVEAVSEYPIGIVRWTRQLCPAGEFVVLPPLGGINLEHLRRWLFKSGTGEARLAKSAPRHAPSDGDVRGLRPYRVGDSPRDVHWKTSARRQQILVREYEQLAPIDLVIIFDPYLPDHPREADRQRFEWCLSLIVSAAWAWVHSDMAGKMTLIIPGEPPIVRTGPGNPGFVRQGFAALAEITGSSHVPAIPVAAVKRHQRSIRWVVSPRPASPVVAAIRQARFAVAMTEPNLKPTWFTPPVGLELPRPLGSSHAQ